MPRNFHTPYVQNFNLNVQQRLESHASFEIGYVGSKGTKLVRLTDINEPDANGDRPNPNYDAMDELAPISSSTYNSLQTTFRMQNNHRFSGFVAYNFSKSLDDASDGIDFAPGAAFPQDPSNLRAEHGPSTFDTNHRFTAAINYDVPRFTRWASSAPDGSLTGLPACRAGSPIPIATSTDTFDPNNNYAYYNQRPSLLPGANPIIHNWKSGHRLPEPECFCAAR